MVLLCKAVVSMLYVSLLFCLGVLHLLFNIFTVLHNHSSLGSSLTLDGQMTMNIFYYLH